MDVIHETASCSFVRLAASAVGMVPIHQRIVESEPQTFGACCIDILANEIPSRSLLRRAIFGEFCIEVTEAFVMLGGHDHVFHAGALGQLRPGASGIRNRLKFWRQPLVFADRNAFVLHYPLVTTERAVKAPVNEHSELRFVPPFHAALAVFDG